MKLKLKREKDGNTETVAELEVKDGKYIVHVGGRRFILDEDDAKTNFISLTTLEVNQL